MLRSLGRKKRFVAVLLGSFGLSLLTPVIAAAGSSQHRNYRDSREYGDSHSNDRYDGRHARRGDYRHHRVRDHRGQRRGYRHDRRHDGYRRGGYNRQHHAQSSYYCAPCDHGFYSRRAFHSHLSGNHHVAPWLLPFAIIEHALGWIFYG
jgi:hypothetical protein